MFVLERLKDRDDLLGKTKKKISADMTGVRKHTHTWSFAALCSCFTVFLSSNTSDMLFAAGGFYRWAIDATDGYYSFLLPSLGLAL